MSKDLPITQLNLSNLSTLQVETSLNIDGNSTPLNRVKKN